MCNIWAKSSYQIFQVEDFFYLNVMLLNLKRTQIMPSESGSKTSY